MMMMMMYTSYYSVNGILTLFLMLSDIIHLKVYRRKMDTAAFCRDILVDKATWLQRHLGDITNVSLSEVCYPT